MLSTLGVNDDNSSSVIKFETVGLQPCFPYYVSLLIHVECFNMTVKHTVIDEGTVVSVMSLACWKGLGSPELSKSATMLTNFDGRSFRPHGNLPSLKVRLGGKTITIEVEVVDVPLDYNILLLQREIPMAWGTTTDSLTPEINSFQYAREIKISNTKGS